MNGDRLKLTPEANPSAPCPICGAASGCRHDRAIAYCRGDRKRPKTEGWRPWGRQGSFSVWATPVGDSILEPAPAEEEGDRPDTDKPRKRESQPQAADLLMAIAQEATYFSTPDEVAYADLEIDGIRQTHPVRKKSFKSWLVRELYRRHKKTVSGDTLNQVLSVLEAEATIAGERREINLRVARGENGKVYFDLGRSDWKAVEIDADGWRVVSDYPVRFRRSPCLSPLPLPNPDGNLDPLRGLLGVEGDSWALISSWLLFSLYPAPAYPVLAIHGQAGSAKTSKTELLKNLIDPGRAGLLKLKHDERELAIQANNRWIMAYDNVSSINQDQSDNLCRISTGFGFSARTLHENDDETLFEFVRPQIINGITSVVTAGDLLSRAVVVELPFIPEGDRVTKEDFDQQIDTARPHILGGLFSALSAALKTLPSVQVAKLDRMADFAKFAVAAEEALGIEPGGFLEALQGNKDERHEIALEASPVATAIRELIEKRKLWEGTASELLKELEFLVDDGVKKSKTFPSDATRLSKLLTRLAPDLRGVGIELTRGEGRDRRKITLELTESQSTDPGDLDKIPAESTQSAPSQPRKPPPTPAAIAVGSTVRKRFYNGWVGTIKRLERETAEVLWRGDTHTQTVRLADIELYREARRA